MGEDAREEQVRRWLAGDRVSLETLVAARPDLASDSAALAALIRSEMALRAAAGETPRTDEYARRFPQCAAHLDVAAPSPRLLDLFADVPDGEGSLQVAVPAELLRALAASPAARSPVAAPSPAQPPPPAPEPNADAAPDAPRAPAPLGEEGAPIRTVVERIEVARLSIPGYEIEEEIGRGGMGFVYRARQLSADRIVALKVIRDDVLESLPDAKRSAAIERFRNEALAAARIEHDHLVSVYEAGEAAGLRYYAMRYVDGRSLYELLRDGPLENRRAAAYLEPVCRAIQAIHEQGVLHRDLKPHNILVDRRGDRPLAADFGLAKFVGARDELTHAGAVLGTPSYMSPEQAIDSRKVGPRSDVYSLGATLYHCVAGRAPFQSAHVADTLRQVLREDPLSPRRLNPDVDRDLETICLKALHKEPARRYASAGELADDLSRYLRGEPIRARPLGVAGRIGRWCRRNPLVATLSAVAAVLTFVAAASVFVTYVQTARALDRSNASLRRALAVVDEFCTSVAEEDLKNLPGFQPLRRDLLLRARLHYESFLKEFGDEPRLRDELGRAHFRMGVLQDELGQDDESLASLDHARRIQSEHLAEAPREERRRRALGDTLNYLGIRLQKAGRYDDATQRLDEALRLRTSLADEYRDAAELQRGVANTLMNLGLVEGARGRDDRDPTRLAEARRRMEQAQARRLAFVERAGDSRRAVERDLARGDYGLAQIELLQWKLLAERESFDAPSPARRGELAARVEADFERARRRFQTLVDEHPELNDRFQLAMCESQLGDFRFLDERDDASLASFESAREQFEALARENPGVASYARQCAETLFRIADLHAENDRRDEAQQGFRRALEALAKARELTPDDPALADLERDIRSALESRTE